MKLSLITLNTPTRENYRGASALPYQLMNYRPKNCKVQIYSYNLNDVDEVIIGQIERELNVKIKILPKNKIFRLLSNRFLLILRVFLNYSVFHFLKLPQSTVKEIEANADNIWIYAEDIGHLSSLFNKSKNV